ncbi:hypothetical protein GCM10027034_42290 [Ramlibacter solisilvae]|uniref:Uncharacterized protein n=1 Tax=Ramlibacter tataouinensis TaxID=94132 RepID=A0A127JTJ5_9BURK|nr:hypothetical protein [Ramlibacter tataouinensis]AMO23287.1 hypothetical protein UC35_10730 [Ramlibacter tataouinensis]
MLVSIRVRATALTLACCAFGIAQAQNVKPPKAQLWMDVSTGTMAGMPEMDSMPGAGMLAGMMGGGRGAGNTSYGMARGMNIMPSRVLDIALHNRLKPGVEASQTIPAGMRMGDSLPLVPPKAEVREPEPGEMPREHQMERPKGRILIYWGCGEAVRSGQPKIIDLSGNPADWGTAFAGRYTPDRGAKVGPAYALYPNEKNRVALSRDSSLVGSHQVVGDGVPASMKFTLGPAQDIMPAIDLQTSGSLKDSIVASWGNVANARAYYLHAMGMLGNNDMVMWSSSETGDTSMGLFDYLSNATIERWLKERVLLQPDTTRCAIPKGIFTTADGKSGEGGMLRMMAYGGESNFAHPPRPADPKAVWEPDWAVRVRVKSQTMAMLGAESSGRGPSASRPNPQPGPAPEQEQGSSGSLIPLPNPAGVLKGLFGR